MSVFAVGCLLLALVLAGDLLGRRLRGGWRRVPLIALSVVLALVAIELTRYDQGHGREVTGIAFVGAPVVVIFGGALALARRWYGYPDLGPMPGRLALVGCAVLAGVMAGTPLHASDVEATMRRGEEIARRFDATSDVVVSESTRMGFFAPPSYAWSGDHGRLSFPVSTRSAFELDAAALRASPDAKPLWKRVDR